MARNAPLTCTLKGVSTEDAVEIISEVAFSNYYFTLSPQQLEAFLKDTVERRPLSTESLSAIAVERGEVLIQQQLSICGGHNSLTETPELAFMWVHPDGDGAAVTVQPTEVPGKHNVLIDWIGQHDYQSAHAVEQRWNIVDRVLDTIGAIDLGTCPVTPLDKNSARYAFTDRAIVEVVPRDRRYNDAVHDPHLTQRNDICRLCVPPSEYASTAPREGTSAHTPSDEEIAAENGSSVGDFEPVPSTITNRMNDLVATLRKITPNIAAVGPIDDLLRSPHDLATSANVPFLPEDSTDDLKVILVEGALLVATRASTGKTLLEDYEAIKAYARRLDDLETPTVNPDNLTAIETTDLRPQKVDPLFAALNLPQTEYFRAALASFIERDDPALVDTVRDGLLDAINGKKPATVHLLRDHLVQELSLGGTVRTYRSALVHPGVTPREQPLIGFRTAIPNRLDPEIGSAFEDAQTIFLIASSDREPELRSIPAPLAQQALNAFGYKSQSLDFLALDISDYSKGDSIGYLSGTLRARF